MHDCKHWQRPRISDIPATPNTTPFALSLSKGFDKLSPNGGEVRS